MAEKYRVVTQKKWADMFSISRLYHENSKIQNYKIPAEDTVLGLTREQYKIIVGAFKVYRDAKEKVILSKDFNDSGLTLEKAILRRRTIRDFSEEPLSLIEVSKLLHFSYGITSSKVIEDSGGVVLPLRAAPSAGALYPLEIYLIVSNIENLERGIYHYNVRDHLLELVNDKYSPEDLYKYTFGSGISANAEIIRKSSLVFVISAIFDRNQWKYQERGYRFILFDAGHIMQNLYLIAIGMNIGVTAIGGFVDDGINGLLGIDGVYESAIYLAAVGKGKKTGEGSSDG